MRIGVDLDGCVYDFVDALRKYISLMTCRPIESMPDATCWEFYKHDWGLTTAEFLGYCDDGVDDGHIFRKGEPMPHALSTMKRFVMAGHTVHIVTSRAFGSWSEPNTRAWLRDHNARYDSLTFSADKTAVVTDMFIDDYPENVEMLRAAGTEAYMLTAGWNRDVDQRWAVGSWAEFEQKVSEREALNVNR